ncbi:PAS domain S-box protein [Methylobacterium sp. E-005]|uniref:CHASE domain-containing protein n=1 Tax=Methylobacterium sp. E-005 TaxID=2836549 RepID=UPI001FBA6724|nr:CHASE domain-containing protein [Methylobacterium sp. E-005]MCJ2086690.1 PAS domain S-box protein [Methylobacterium sp. E-005]
MTGRFRREVKTAGLRTAGFRQRPVLTVIAVAIAGMLAAAGAAELMTVRNDGIARARHAQASARVATLITERMAIYEKALRGLRGAIAAVGPNAVTRDAFERYAQTRDLNTEFPGMRGYGFIRRVAQVDEAAFVGRARSESEPGFTFRQLTPWDGERYVIEFVTPSDRNAAAVGLDVASEAHRREAAETAMDTGRATLSAPVTLVQATGMQGRGFLLFLPVLKPGAPQGTSADRRAATVGWTYAPLVIDEILAGVDLGGEGLEVILRDTASGEGDVFVRQAVDEGSGPVLSRTTTLPVYGREWQVETRAGPAFVADLGLQRPATVALVAFALAGLIASLLAIRSSADRLQREAAAENGRLAAIVASAQDAIIGKTLDGVITEFNPAAERLFGIPADEALGRRAAGLMIPEHRWAEERWSLARAGLGEPTPPQASWRKKADGSEFPVQVSVAPIRSPGGQVTGVATVIRDATEQVAADKRIHALNVSLEGQVAERTAALQASSALQRAVIANAGYSVIATDLEGTVTLFNPAAGQLLGYTEAEVVGRMTPATFHDPDEVALRAESLSAEIGRPVEPGIDVFVTWPRRGRPETREWTYITQGGRRLPVLLSVSLLRSDDGRDLGYLGIAIDLSERYRHRAEMRAAEAGTWSYDVATGRVLFSAECARQHGLPEREIELDVERDWRPLAHPDDVPHVLADLAHAVAHGGSYTTEFRVPLPDGGVRWINARGRVESDAAGRTVRVLGLTLDTTARKEAEIALTKAKAEAERANRAKTDFLASMSHEIRTPLNAVLGFTDLMLSSGRLDPGTRRQANHVRSSGAALLTVVNDILDFSKVEAGAVELVEGPFALPALLDNCVAIVRGAADTKGLELRLRLDPALPRWVRGDESRLRQVLLNLLNNAVKFTAVGSVTLDVAPGLADDAVRIQVIDTGVGIPADKRDRLFRHFSQVDGSIQRDYGGTGLGLAICSRLVGLMGAAVEVSSEAGIGSTFAFTVRLPPAEPVLEGPTVVPARPGSRGRILLVDDSGVNRELAEAVLTGAGHRVQTAIDGQTAVEAVKARRFDLVLMDVQMPGMDGMAATRAIRALGPPVAAVPVLAMTANVLPEQIDAYHAAGMNGYLAKPFDRAVLLATVARLLPATGAEDTVLHPGLDETVYLATQRGLSPTHLRQVLGIFATELKSSFHGDSDDPVSRRDHRHRAHTLCASSAMIGFTGLSIACREVEGFDEARVEREGVTAFATKIAEARQLALSAHSTVEDLCAEVGPGQADKARLTERGLAG